MKRRIKKNKKNKNFLSLRNIVLIVFAIAFCLVGVAYATLSQQLFIGGTSTIADIQISTDTVTWTKVYGWGGNGNNRYEQIKIDIENNDEDTVISELSFDVPDTIIRNNSSVWICEGQNFTVSGNTITIVNPYEWFYTPAVKTVLSFEMQLCFEDDVDFYIDNLKVNGKLVTQIN